MVYVLGILLILPILILCVILVCALRKHQKPYEPALTPRDLQVLQESAEDLIASITSTAEEAMSRFEESRSSLEQLIARAEKAADFLETRLGTSSVRRIEEPDKVREAAHLQQQGLNTVDIARRLNVGAGEVELLLSLRPRMDRVSS